MAIECPNLLRCPHGRIGRYILGLRLLTGPPFSPCSLPSPPTSPPRPARQSAPPRSMASSAGLHWADTSQEHEELDDDLPELPSTSIASGSAKGSEKVVRRRSSKACDQCRKSKCKCERTSEHEPCRSCVLLGTECTFLGPSRKRGPPKGYIDAIESRLHQLEALLGIIIASSDSRAQSLVDDLSQDTLAREIIARVDNSPFGPKGRKQVISSSRDTYMTENGHDGASTSRTKRHLLSRSALAIPPDGSTPFVTPSNEWQDHLGSRLLANGLARSSSQQPPSTTYGLYNQSAAYPVNSLTPLQIDMGPFTAAYSAEDVKPSPTSAISPTTSTGRLSAFRSASGTRGQNASISPTRRQRRRIDEHDPVQLSRAWSASPQHSDGYSSAETSDSDDLAGAVGQLSLDDHEQLRFHGKASGLHLLGTKERRDKRIENGIWRFPPARVWPPALNHVVLSEEEIAARARLPPRDQQEHLLELYFTYVHPQLPVVAKFQFLEDFRARSESPYNEVDSPASMPSTSSRKLAFQKVPTLLLLAMFALASRYSNLEQPLPPEGTMWDAGDSYLEDAKTVLNKVYASSRLSTCQALLLMSYREIGIGAMAQAWLYVGMAVRMAQDLGLNRSFDKWRGGTSLFTAPEIQLRRRTWYACVIMDRYVSTYIGRPLAIYERDFDTPLPTEEEHEEQELWNHHPSLAQDLEHNKYMEKSDYIPVPSRPIACFNAAATLASLISCIVQSLYSIRSPNSAARQAEADNLEKRLDKWYLELPDHLRYDPSVRKLPIPPPHVMTLNMNYWTAVLLLHRPFIHFKTHEASDDASSLKAWDLCMRAATHISSILAVYNENFCLKRSAAFLSYYIFSAGIMHVTTLTMRPSNIQASLGLQQCMDSLKAMNILWPSAGRAWELLHGSNVDVHQAELARLSHAGRPNKRPANDQLESEDVQQPAAASGMHPYRAQPLPHAPPSRPLPVSSSFSSLGPTTTASSDSFFGPYSRWGPDIYQQPSTSHTPHASYSQPHHHHSQPPPAPPPSHAPPPHSLSQSSMASMTGYTVPSHTVPSQGITQNVNGSRYNPNYWGEYQETFSEPPGMGGSIYSQSMMPPPLPPPGSNMQQVHPHAPPASTYPDFPGYGATTVMQTPYNPPPNRMHNGSHAPPSHHPQ
ncbi:hypothetical protein AURDEDRAFT_158861 [Auricularia subglabra TFB-10046 SS5]|nr:hypothetical protein AURDEDRAFT_158861 [Auricularia subglabra TFB-10046 SS5]